MEEFAQQFTKVIRRFLRLKEWRDTECLVIGGGFRASRIGELVIGRSAVLLKADGVDVDLELIRNDPDEAGLIGGAHLLPAWMLKGHDALLTVDVGGTNIRAGLVELNLGKANDLGKARVADSKLWRTAMRRSTARMRWRELIEMLRELIGRSEKSKLNLAPVIAIGCPGVIHEEGRSPAALRTCPVIGRVAASIFPAPFVRVSHKLASTRR